MIIAPVLQERRFLPFARRIGAPDRLPMSSCGSIRATPKLQLGSTS